MFGWDCSAQVRAASRFRLGDIVQQDGDVFGDGVNIASRLQELAEPDTICISQKVYEEVEKKLPLGTVVSLGRPKLKNIAQRFQVYTLLPEQPKGPQENLRVLRLRTRKVGTTLLPRPMLVLVSVLSSDVPASLRQLVQTSIRTLAQPCLNSVACAVRTTALPPASFRAHSARYVDCVPPPCDSI
jgi:hypothetical protein